MTDQTSDIQAPGQSGGYPSVTGGMSRAPGYPSPSMAPQQQRRRGGMINKFKVPQIGKGDLVGNSQLIKQLVAEFLGTFLLVFFGIGSIITAMGGGGKEYFYKGKKGYSFESVPSDDKDFQKKITKNGDEMEYAGTYVSVGGHGGGAIILHISFAFGIAVASIAQAIGHVSGAHLNPAVSFGLVAAGECSILKAVIYSVTQIIGAMCGAGLLKVLTYNYITSKHPKENVEDKDYDASKHTIGWGLGTSTLGTCGYVDGIAMECILTFMLVLTICGATDGLRKDVTGSAPLAIGLAVFLCHIVGIAYTGSSVNPARSIGPVFFTMNIIPNKNGLKHLAVYIAGPFMGGILAGFLYNLFFRASPPEEENQQVSPEGPKRIG